jgi:hypothetical protein
MGAVYGMFRERGSGMSADAGVMEMVDVDLETWLDDSIPCEFRHTVTTCSVTVTHRVMSCKASAFACTNGAVKREELNRLDADLPCTTPGCTKTIGECWKVVPV